MDLFKMKNSPKSTNKRMRRQGTDWKNLFAKDLSDKGQFLKCTKNSYNLEKEMQNLIKKSY